MFSGLDYLVVLLYLSGTLALGVWVSRRVKSGEDYFLAGRSLPWWAIGMSLVATDIGGTDIVGVGGAAYAHGLAVANFEWIGCVPAMIVCAFVFAPHFWRLGIYTIPEFLERRFHVSLRAMLAICWLVFMACNLGVLLFASAQMIIVLLGIDWTGLSIGGVSLRGWELLITVIAIAAVTGSYTALGGLAAVVYTDVVQCTVLIAGCLCVLVLGLAEVGGPTELLDRVAAREASLSEEVAAERGELILPVDTRSPFPWTAIYFGLALVLSPAYWIGNQAIIQRAFGAKSDFEAKASFVWGALLKNVIPLIIAVPGLIAFALYPDLGSADHAFPTLATRLLPTGIRGIFVAAFVAALMSSVDSYLNAAATILSFDLVGRFARKKLASTAFLGRVTTIGLSVWGVGFALWCATLESGVYSIFQTLMSFFQGPALALLLCGVFWRRANMWGAVSGFVGGVLTSLTLFTLNLEPVRSRLNWEPLFRIPDPFLYYSIWSFLVAMALLVTVSLATKPPSAAQVEPLVYRRTKGARA